MAGGYKLFSTGEVLTAANVNNYLMKQTVMVFASAAARTTALSGVLAEGMISYRTDAHVLEVYNGTVWEAPDTQLTTKGDLAVFSTAPDRLGVGSNNQILTADSTQTAGIKWATSPILGSTTLIPGSTTTTLPGVTSVNGSTIPSSGTWYTAPTIGTTSITSGGTFTTLPGVTSINGTTIPSSVTLTKTTDNLSVFAATTSAQLAGVLSDETGTGSVVFGTSPTLTTPKIALTYSAKTAAYTFVSGDEGNIFSMNNAATQQFNIPTDATFNFAVGTQFNVFWVTGAGQPTIGAVTPGTTTVISTGATSATPKLRVANSMATVMKIATNSWIVIGDIA